MKSLIVRLNLFGTAFLLFGCAANPKKSTTAQSSITPTSFKSLGHVCYPIDEECNSLKISRDGVGEAFVRTKEKGFRRFSFVLSPAKRSELIQTAVQSGMKDTMFGYTGPGGAHGPVDLFQVSTTRGVTYTSYYYADDHTPLRQVSVFLRTKVWPDVYRKVRAEGYTTLPRPKDSPTELPQILPEVEHSGNTR